MFTLYERIQIEGLMPQRALLRLRRAGISLYRIQKTRKDCICLQVERKDLFKVFALYPKTADGQTPYSPYKVKQLGGVGVARAVDFCKNRLGFVLGVLLFCILTLAADGFVFGVDFVGAQEYKRETMQALEENGVTLFTPYKKGKEDLVTAKLLSLDFVEFCSVQKVGNRLRVEIQTSPFSINTLVKGSMRAKHAGEIISLTVLKGTALKKIGDKVVVGETLVQDVLTTQEGEQVRVEAIARVRISCVYEGVHEGAETAEQAFAEAYLSLELGERDEIISKSVTQTEKGFHVKITYLVTESINL